MIDGIERLLASRESTHGFWLENAKWGQDLRELFRSGPGWETMSSSQREALDYIAGKLARLLSSEIGSSHIDTWEDIAGYAHLAATEMSR